MMHHNHFLGQVVDTFLRGQKRPKEARYKIKFT